MLDPGSTNRPDADSRGLVDNASKFSRFGTLLEILLGSDGALQITDEGRGMSEEEISLIGAFRQFECAKHEQQGLGLGLISVQKLAARNGAKFSVARGPEQGILVRIEFQPGNGKAEAGGCLESASGAGLSDPSSPVLRNSTISQ